MLPIVPPKQARVNPGRGRRPSSGTEDPHKLPNPERGRWEREAVKGLRCSRKAVLGAIVDRCYGKPWAHPSDATIAEDTGLTPRTVGEALTDLDDRGLIRRVRIGSSLVRYIVVLSHPHAAAFLAGPGVHSWPRNERHLNARQHPEKRGVTTPKNGVLDSPKNGVLDTPKNRGSYDEAPNEKLELEHDDERGTTSSIFDLSPGEDPEPAREPAPDRVTATDTPRPEEIPTPIPEVPQGANTAAEGEDLAPLIAKAEKRFGANMGGRVREAVETFGRDWVEIILWGVKSLKEWGGVWSTLAKWKEVGGPTQQERNRGRQAMANSVPPPYYRAPALPAAPAPPPMTREEREAWNRRVAEDLARTKAEREAAQRRDEASQLVARIHRHGHGLAIGPDGELEWTVPEVPVPPSDPCYADGARMYRQDHEEFKRKAAPLESEIKDLLRSRGRCRPDPARPRRLEVQ